MTSPNQPFGAPQQGPQYQNPGSWRPGTTPAGQNGFTGQGPSYQQPSYQQPASFPGPRFSSTQPSNGGYPPQGPSGPQSPAYQGPAYQVPAGPAPFTGTVPPAGYPQPAALQPAGSPDGRHGKAPHRLPQYGANPLQAFARFFTKYAVFNGRASKSEYWWMQFWRLVINWFLVPAVTVYCLYICFVPILGVSSDSIATVQISLRNCLFVAIGVMILAALVDLGLLIPRLSLRVRRLHDAGASGWWAAFWLVPVAAAVIVTFASYVVIFICFFSIIDNLPQVDQVLNSDVYDLSRLDRFLPYRSGTLLVLFAYVLLIIAIASVAALIFDLVVGLLSTDPSGARFDAPEPAPTDMHEAAHVPAEDTGAEDHPHAAGASDAAAARTASPDPSAGSTPAAGTSDMTGAVD